MTSRGPTGAGVRFETVCGQRLCVSVHGPPSSPPLLLIGGIGAPLELWGGFRDGLGRTTIAFDAPGTGASPAPWRLRPMFELAHLVLRLLDRLEIDAVDVLGISWGGGLAQHVALLGGSRVRRLVLAATGFGLGSIPASISAAAELLTPARYTSPQRLQLVGPQIFGGETRRRPELLREHGAIRSRHAPSRRGYVYQLLAAAMWASLPWLPLVRAETLLLYGDDDPIVSVANGRVLRRVMPNATLHVVPGAGHLFLIDQPDDAAAIVEDFLSGPWRADGRSGDGGLGPAPQAPLTPDPRRRARSPR
jgi:pimeloyl-ACP methyl ester carboxylesterase